MCLVPRISKFNLAWNNIIGTQTDLGHKRQCSAEGTHKWEVTGDSQAGLWGLFATKKISFWQFFRGPKALRADCDEMFGTRCDVPLLVMTFATPVRNMSQMFYVSNCHRNALCNNKIDPLGPLPAWPVVLLGIKLAVPCIILLFMITVGGTEHMMLVVQYSSY